MIRVILMRHGVRARELNFTFRFGHAFIDTVGRNVEMIVPIEYRDRHRDGPKRAMAGVPRSADAEPFHLPILCRDGTVVVFAARFVFLDTPSGQTIGATVILEQPDKPVAPWTPVLETPHR